MSTMNQTDIMALITGRATRAGSSRGEIGLDYVSLKTIEDAIAKYPGLTTAEAELYLNPENDIMPEAVLAHYLRSDEEAVAFDIPSAPGQIPPGKQIDIRHLGDKYADILKGD